MFMQIWAAEAQSCPQKGPWDPQDRLSVRAWRAAVHEVAKSQT